MQPEKINLPFKPGEIITGRSDLKFTKRGKESFISKKRKRFRSMSYTIDGASLRSPFLPGLLSKKFVIFYDEKELEAAKERYGTMFHQIINDYVSVTLLENYKPFVYGKGHRLRIGNLDIFKTTGEIIHDFRKLPYLVKATALERAKRKHLSNSYVNYEGGTHEEKLHFQRKYVHKIFSRDLYVCYSLLQVLNTSCNNCGINLCTPKTSLLDLTEDRYKTTQIKEEICNIYGYTTDVYNKRLFTFVLFPVGYSCSSCNSLTILFSTALDEFNFSTVTLRRTENYIKPQL